MLPEVTMATCGDNNKILGRTVLAITFVQGSEVLRMSGEPLPIYYRLTGDYMEGSYLEQLCSALLETQQNLNLLFHDESSAACRSSGSGNSKLVAIDNPPPVSSGISKTH